MTTLPIRRAELVDVDDISALWTRASEWLGTTGTDQWQYPVRTHAIRDEVAAGEAWIVRDDGRLLASVTLEAEDHGGLWKTNDHLAFYVHRLVVERGNRPADLGGAILDWAARCAHNAGRPLLRLDAWTTNTGLHKYYLDRGFRHVRTVENTQSGALFERPSAVQLHRGPALVETS